MREMSGVATELSPAKESGRQRSELPSGLIGALVSSAFSADDAALRGPSRGEANVALARQVAVYLLHTRFGLSYSSAGRCFARDRTTAAYACRKIEERREDARFDALIECLEMTLIVALEGMAR